jgi:hypothetical protein
MSGSTGFSDSFPSRLIRFDRAGRSRLAPPVHVGLARLLARHLDGGPHEPGRRRAADPLAARSVVLARYAGNRRLAARTLRMDLLRVLLAVAGTETLATRQPCDNSPTGSSASRTAA